MAPLLDHTNENDDEQVGSSNGGKGNSLNASFLPAVDGLDVEMADFFIK